MIKYKLNKLNTKSILCVYLFMLCEVEVFAYVLPIKW